MLKKQVVINVDLEQFRYSLIGNGYLKSEVESLTEERLVQMLQSRISDKISKDHDKAKRLGLLED